MGLPVSDPNVLNDAPPSADREYLWNSANTNWTPPRVDAAAAAATPAPVGRPLGAPDRLSPMDRRADTARSALCKLAADPAFALYHGDLKLALLKIAEHEELKRQNDMGAARIAE